MKHTYQEHNFQHLIVPPDLNAIAASNKFRRFDVGRLVQLLAGQLRHSPRLRSVSQLFGLLNFTDTFTKFSHGYSGVPPRSVWPAHHCQIYTFALTGEDYDLLGTQRAQIGIHLSANLVVWGYTDIQFVSIGLTSVECFELGLTSILHFDAYYLYNIIGTITKNLVHYNDLDWYSSADEFYTSIELVGATKYLQKPLPNLFTSDPYKYWIFSRRMWMHMPNLFHSVMVNERTAEYYFRHCNTSSKLVTTADASRKTIFGLDSTDSGIIGILYRSILSFLQAMRNESTEFYKRSEYLAPLILMSMVENRTNQITADNEAATAAIKMFSERAALWSNILSNPLQLAQRMLDNDQSLADSLLALVDMDDGTDELDI